MRTIYKYPVSSVPGQHVIYIPEQSIFLNAAVINGELCLYFVVDSELGNNVAIKVNLICTGHPLPEAITEEDYNFVGSFEINTLVFHVFVEQ